MSKTQLDQFDPEMLKSVVTEMLTQLIKDPYTETDVQVTVKIPTCIYDGFIKLATAMGLSTQPLFDEMATQGIRTSFRALAELKNTVSPQPTDSTTSCNKLPSLDPQALGLDLGGLDSQLSQLTNLVSQMQAVQGLVSSLDPEKK